MSTKPKIVIDFDEQALASYREAFLGACAVLKEVADLREQLFGEATGALTIPSHFVTRYGVEICTQCDMARDYCGCDK